MPGCRASATPGRQNRSKKTDPPWPGHYAPGRASSAGARLIGRGYKIVPSAYDAPHNLAGWQRIGDSGYVAPLVLRDTLI